MKKILLLLLLIYSGWSCGQNQIKSSEDLENTYLDYFSLNRENIHLQLNKTTLVEGENLWFSAYVFDPRIRKPNLETTNLHVNLYNADGRLLEAKTIYIQDGKGRGYFDLDALNPGAGSYFVRAFTRYMDNFREEADFIQSFSILGTENLPEKVNEKVSYDFQLLPEGGHLLAGAQNTIGVKLTNQTGRGVKFSDGKVLNAKGETITTFTSNNFGLSSFTLHYKPNEQYKAVVKLEDGSTLENPLISTDAYGIAFSVNNFMKDFLFISVFTNEQSMEKVGGKTFYIALHRQGVLQSVSFQFPEDKTETSIRIEKELLADGVNILTILDENFKPLLERQIFHGDIMNRPELTAAKIKNHGDSIEIRLNNRDLAKQWHKISLSVLPEKTKAYQPENDIVSSFYLQPFVKGFVERGSYYFAPGDERRKAYDLDLLLLTQGWSKYNWDHILKGSPTEFFKQERGFAISGRVNSKLEKEERQLMIKSDSGFLFEVVDLDKDNNFELDRLFLMDSTEVSFGVMGGKGSKVEAPKIYARILPQKDDKNYRLKSKLLLPVDESGKRPLRQSIPVEFTDGSEVLDSVFIKAQLEKKNLESRRYATSKRYLSISEEMTQMYPYVVDYIGTQGYIVDRTMGDVTIKTPGSTSLRGMDSPIIVLDGMEVVDNFELAHLLTSDVESIHIDKIGTSYGVRGSGGVITIKTKSGAFVTGGKASVTTRAVTILNGFAENKEFFTPRYTDYFSELYSEYGAIEWLSDVELDQATGNYDFKILNDMQKNVKLFIQGMAADGSLVSQEILLNLR